VASGQLGAGKDGGSEGTHSTPGASGWGKHLRTESKVDAHGGKKVGQFGLMPGGMYASSAARAEIEMEREQREAAVRIRDTNPRARRDRTIECIAGDVTHPGRVKARLVRKMKALGVPFDEMCAVLFTPDERYAQRVYGITHDTGEHRPAA
jgi:hypothetical protein